MSENIRMSLIRLLMSTGNCHRKLISKELSEYGLYSGQFRILMYIADRAEISPSQKEIAETFDISPAAVAVAISKLEKNGLIAKTTFNKDNRVNNISLTEKGKELTKKVTERVNEVSESMLSVLSDEETQFILNSFYKINDYFKQL